MDRLKGSRLCCGEEAAPAHCRLLAQPTQTGWARSFSDEILLEVKHTKPKSRRDVGTKN